MDIGIVTDEVSRNLSKSLDICAEWGLEYFELREGQKARFPSLMPEEVQRIDALLLAGGSITAVSPGIFKGHIEDRERWLTEAEETTPQAIELAKRFECDVLIAFGFEECDDKSENRLQVLKAFERVAKLAEEAGMIVAIENEPGFWIDRPESSLALLREIGHPALRLNWDPANLLWGGGTFRDETVESLQNVVANLHVKDVEPEDEDVPWRPLGQGRMPWRTLMPEIVDTLSLSHVTIETHCEPLVENSRISLDFLTDVMESIDTK